jgi:hypothetical protein
LWQQISESSSFSRHQGLVAGVSRQLREKGNSYMRKYPLVVIIITICFASVVGFQLSRKEIAARKVAESWLPLLDAQEYGKSWEELSPIVKRTLRKEHWEIALTELRSPLGKLESRTFFSVEYIRSVKGYPKREGALVRFMSHFENGSTLESVHIIHDKDGKWRVTTYMRIPSKKEADSFVSAGLTS